MCRNKDHGTPPHGSAAEYELAAELARHAELLADAVDDNLPGWLGIALSVSDLLDALVTTRLDTVTDWTAVLANIYARAGRPVPAAPMLSPWETAADLSATAGDLAAAIAEDRTGRPHLARARRLLDALERMFADGGAE